MKRLSVKKVILLTLAFCIAFSLVFAEIHAVRCLNHNCILANCPICLQIEIANNFLKVLKMAGMILLFSGCMLFFTGILQTHPGPAAYSLSPVALKVRFNS